ncbi:glycosyltransferase family 2 protein [Daejeonella sp.]|uniref:glycosyltransferase family 2 protein n=1 Tax=Daejeonella sp. TaxID=2805397 RepID=UPI00271F67BC|nr:glycosyltransferase family 2 protein [Daejeonella sp.]MDO8992787.1 glycosyltransferase family 2 protein [Daejeonella sp.]MDP2413636.1 glycosyltransferase family 2 protein [Daejeonella sp.]
MTKVPKVAAVILNWNGKNFLEKFLPSVVASTFPGLEIVVGDNASTDSSIEFLKKKYPTIRIIQNDKNYGFAGGYNRILEQLDTEYFILLNSDVEVSPGWIEPVIHLMESEMYIAAAQPKILSYSQKDHFEYAGAAGGYLDSLGYPFCRGRIFDTVEQDHGQYDDQSEIFWASGAALFIKRKYWIEIGGLDPDFFAHMEEIDLCWRLKNKGYMIVFCPKSKVYHVGGGTLKAESTFKTYLNFRNNLVLLQKNLSFGKAFLVIFIRFWLDLLSLIKYLIDGKPGNAMAISKAHFYFIGHLFKNTIKARKINVSKFNASGLYKGSIVWQYFIRKKKIFSSLKKTI